MVIILMGGLDAGKTRVGKHLAAELRWSFYEGDDYHSQSNVEKMSQGIALTDADRAPGLDALHELIGELLAQKESAVLTCSALKRAYRERLSHGHDGVLSSSPTQPQSVYRCPRPRRSSQSACMAISGVFS